MTYVKRPLEARTSDPKTSLTPKQELRKTLDEFFVGLSHFYDCCNFNSSFFDAEAFRWMHETPGKIHEALKKVEGGD